MWLPMVDTKSAQRVWQQDAKDATSHTWICAFTPIVACKKGLFSPWWMPWTWFTRRGAFSFVCVIVVSQDLLMNCPAEVRKAIVTHECGHIVGGHSLVWTAFVLLNLRLDFLKNALALLADAAGPWAGVWGLLVLILVLGLCARWLLYAFEYWADDFTVRHLGGKALIHALEWTRNYLYGNAKHSWIEERVSRIREKHP